MKSKPVQRPVSRLTVFVLFAALGVGCAGEKSQDVAPRPVAVRTAQPVTQDLEDKLSYVGTVHARQEVLIVAQVQGTLAVLPRPEGAAVEPGDVIADLHAPELEAVAERLRADRDYWSERHRADERLVAAGALPREQAAASLRACKSAEASLAEAEARLARKTETSPIKGRVLSWLAEPGQHVMPGQALLHLGSDTLEIHVEVVEEDLRRGIRTGSPVKIRTGEIQAIESIVIDVAPMTTGTSRTFTAKMLVPPANATGLRVGASVRVEFVLASCKGCLSVPAQAVQKGPEGAYLFLVRDGRAVRQQVTTGIQTDGMTEVSMPWNGRDAVAITNLGSLANGVPVFPVGTEEVSR